MLIRVTEATTGKQKIKESFKLLKGFCFSLDDLWHSWVLFNTYTSIIFRTSFRLRNSNLYSAFTSLIYFSHTVICLTFPTPLPYPHLKHPSSFFSSFHPTMLPLQPPEDFHNVTQSALSNDLLISKSEGLFKYVPQGLILSPFLFSFYSLSMSNIIFTHLCNLTSMLMATKQVCLLQSFNYLPTAWWTLQMIGLALQIQCVQISSLHIFFSNLLSLYICYFGK